MAAFSRPSRWRGSVCWNPRGISVGGAGRWDPLRPISPRGRAPGLQGSVGWRQPFLGEQPAAVPCPGEPEIVRGEPRGPGCGRRRRSAIPLPPLRGRRRARAPPPAAASGKGAGLHHGSVLPRPGSPSRAASWAEKPRNWLSARREGSGAAPSGASRESRGCCGIAQPGPAGPQLQPSRAAGPPKTPRFNPSAPPEPPLPPAGIAAAPSVACPAVTLLEFQPDRRIPACSCGCKQFWEHVVCLKHVRIGHKLQMRLITKAINRK
ncbi:basic salivary proline-rich protein 1-like [Passer montanus]|uniref:basic salivary proline-rich protein 1-like n=1 Tax=Passer montanus TaxID=9160 RepID=UPI0019611724|nr:basic salivary proline-rich protein 1-like [Passer montanus]